VDYFVSDEVSDESDMKKRGNNPPQVVFQVVF